MWCDAMESRQNKKWGDLQKNNFRNAAKKVVRRKKKLLRFEFVFHHSTFKTWKVLRRWKESSLGDADSLVRSARFERFSTGGQFKICLTSCKSCKSPN